MFMCHGRIVHSILHVYLFGRIVHSILHAFVLLVVRLRRHWFRLRPRLIGCNVSTFALCFVLAGTTLIHSCAHLVALRARASQQFGGGLLLFVVGFPQVRQVAQGPYNGTAN